MARVVAGLERLERRGCPLGHVLRRGQAASPRNIVPLPGSRLRFRGRSAGSRPRRQVRPGPRHHVDQVMSFAACVPLPLAKPRPRWVRSRHAAVPPPNGRRCPQDTTRGPASASRGSRLRGARLLSVSPRLPGSSVMISPPPARGTRKRPTSLRIRPSASAVAHLIVAWARRRSRTAYAPVHMAEPRRRPDGGSRAAGHSVEVLLRVYAMCVHGRAPRHRDPREAEAGPLVESCPGSARAASAYRR